MKNLKQVIIDRGIYRLGVQYENGENQDPKWESTFDGNCLVIGHEDELFNISSVDDMVFILKELQERLQLNYEVEKLECECGFEFYYDTQKYTEALECCPNCRVEFAS